MIIMKFGYVLLIIAFGTCNCMKFLSNNEGKENVLFDVNYDNLTSTADYQEMAGANIARIIYILDQYEYGPITQQPNVILLTDKTSITALTSNTESCKIPFQFNSVDNYFCVKNPSQGDQIQCETVTSGPNLANCFLGKFMMVAPRLPTIIQFVFSTVFFQFIELTEGVVYVLDFNYLINFDSCDPDTTHMKVILYDDFSFAEILFDSKDPVVSQAMKFDQWNNQQECFQVSQGSYKLGINATNLCQNEKIFFAIDEMMIRVANADEALDIDACKDIRVSTPANSPTVLTTNEPLTTSDISQVGSGTTLLVTNTNEKTTIKDKFTQTSKNTDDYSRSTDIKETISIITVTNTNPTVKTETNTVNIQTTITNAGTLQTTETKTETFESTVSNTKQTAQTETNTVNIQYTLTNTDTAIQTGTNTGTIQTTLTNTGTQKPTGTKTQTFESTVTNTNPVGQTETYTGTIQTALTNTVTFQSTVSNTKQTAQTETNTGSIQYTLTNTNTAIQTGTNTGTIQTTLTNTGTQKPTDTKTETFESTVTNTNTAIQTGTNTGTIQTTLTNTGTQKPTDTKTETFESTVTNTKPGGQTETNTGTFKSTVSNTRQTAQTESKTGTIESTLRNTGNIQSTVSNTNPVGQTETNTGTIQSTVSNTKQTVTVQPTEIKTQTSESTLLVTNTNEKTSMTDKFTQTSKNTDDYSRTTDIKETITNTNSADKTETNTVNIQTTVANIFTLQPTPTNTFSRPTSSSIPFTETKITDINTPIELISTFVYSTFTSIQHSSRNDRSKSGYKVIFPLLMFSVAVLILIIAFIVILYNLYYLPRIHQLKITITPDYDLNIEF